MLKICFYVILVLLIFAAAYSGMTKIILLQQDVEFYAQYGFSEFQIIIFGIFKLLGALLIAIPKSRIVGSTILIITLAISMTMFILSDKITMAVSSLILIALIGFIIWQQITHAYRIKI